MNTSPFMDWHKEAQEDYLVGKQFLNTTAQKFMHGATVLTRGEA
jgi:hypothetical protein